MCWSHGRRVEASILEVSMPVGPIWALASLRASPGARRHFDARRAAGDWNHQAQRHLFNKFLGQLHHCLRTGQLYDEHWAFPPPLTLAA